MSYIQVDERSLIWSWHDVKTAEKFRLGGWRVFRLNDYGNLLVVAEDVELFSSKLALVISISFNVTEGHLLVSQEGNKKPILSMDTPQLVGKLTTLDEMTQFVECKLLEQWQGK